MVATEKKQGLSLVSVYVIMRPYAVCGGVLVKAEEDTESLETGIISNYGPMCALGIEV